MSIHDWFPLGRPANVPAPGRRRPRRRRSAAIGLLRPESLEDRALLTGASVTTTAATGLTGTGATLNGTVNPNNLTIATAFEYGTNADLAPNVVTTLAGTAGTPGSTDGTGSAASFSSPEGVAVDTANGDIYVADVNNDVIRQVTPAGVVTTLAGTAGTSGSTDGTGAAALFNHPTAVAVDPATGNIYVADSGNDVIRQVTSSGVVTTLAGTAGTAGSTDGTGAAALFNDPQGIAFDTTTGNIFVSDSGNDTIRQVTTAGVVTTLAGTAGTPGSTDGAGSAASFNDPTGLVTDPTTGNIYVSDTANDTIRQVTSAGVVTTLAGTAGTSGSSDGTGSSASFDAPRGISEDTTTGFLFVSDTGNDAIRLIAPGAVVTTLAGSAGTSGSTDATGAAASFDVPYGVAFNSVSDTAYVGDTGNDTIRQLSLTTVAAQSGLTGNTPLPIDAAVTGLLPGTTYYFRAVGSTGTPPNFNGSILNFTTPVPPAATTQAATSLTGTGATLNASVNPEGDATTVQFIYGTDPTLTTGTTTVPATPLSAGSGTSAVPLNEPITGLVPNTTYYFEVAATSSGGTTDGTILTFTTPAVPTATTQAATSLSTTGATLNASVNPEGFATTVQFIYGTDPTLMTGTTTVPATPLSAGSGTSDVPINESLTGLAPGTTYYFEVAATNSGGTTDGSILSFTTSTVPQPVVSAGATTNVSSGGATIGASVNPNGVATTVHFVYGTSQTLSSGTMTTADQSIGSGTAAVPVTATLTGLTPGTKYYYEAVAASNGVMTAGPIQSFTTAAASVAGPMVTNLQRYGYHSQATTFVLTFNQALNPASAQDVANYTIVSTSGSNAGRAIPIASATYNSANHTVTLQTVDRVYLYGQYQITVRGTSPSGLTNATGQFLEGQGGQAGTNYVQSFGESILAGPNLSMAMSPSARARIVRSWPHERSFAARIAARDEARARRDAVRSAHHAAVVVAGDVPAIALGSARSAFKAEVVDAVIGTFDLQPKGHRRGRA